MTNVSVNAILELNNAGVPDGTVSVLDDRLQAVRFLIPSIASVGTMQIMSLPTTDMTGKSTSVGLSFNMQATLSNDFSYPAVGSSMPVVYVSLASSGLVVRDNWTRVA